MKKKSVIITLIITFSIAVLIASIFIIRGVNNNHITIVNDNGNKSYYHYSENQGGSVYIYK